MTTHVENGGWRRSPWRVAMWAAAALLLLLPFIAMQFTSEVNWDETDFIVFGAMLAIAGAAFDGLALRTPSFTYRVGVAVAVATAFLLVWVNLAVGFIGSEDNPLNLIFAGVIGIAVGGALLARFRAQGMACAMTAAALAQTLAGIVALTDRAFLFAPTAIFVALWLTSAWLFRKAAGQSSIMFGS